MYLFLKVTCLSPVLRRTWLGKKFQGLLHAVVRLAACVTSLGDAMMSVTLHGEPSVPFRRRNRFAVDTTPRAERLHCVYGQKSWGHLRACVGRKPCEPHERSLLTEWRTYGGWTVFLDKANLWRASLRRGKAFKLQPRTLALKKNNLRKSAEDLQQAAVQRRT